KAHPVFILLLLLLLMISRHSAGQNRLTEKLQGYQFSYTSGDKKNIKEYLKFIDHGISAVKAFFHSSFKKEFTVFLY
ncbi:hypothetical protein NL526_30610, partial [Klebsiella pneumoniae]|nr:hypothetical protein [Klebsiella pneumoniae]